ncbi:MAG: helix-turn-helix domain-containing protein, partial [Bacteroidales bacterium]|nr:helix-turn-helix domain-containing protein [Bacteroidales bacterium]
TSRKKAGNVVLIKHNDRKFLEYSLTEHLWKEGQPITISDQEKELLNLTARGFVYKEMADIIHLSEETVKKNCQKLMKKFGVNKMAEALMYAINYALF